MNWDAIGAIAIAEALGAAGVIITLTFLVGQLRMNNRLLRSESERAGTQLSNELGLVLAQDRGVSELFSKGLSQPKSLDHTDRVRFTWLMSVLMGSMHITFVDHELGLTTDEEISGLRSSLGGLVDTPGGRWFWKRNKDSYRPSLVAAIEREFEMDI